MRRSVCLVLIFKGIYDRDLAQNTFHCLWNYKKVFDTQTSGTEIKNVKHLVEGSLWGMDALPFFSHLEFSS